MRSRCKDCGRFTNRGRRRCSTHRKEWIAEMASVFVVIGFATLVIIFVSVM